MKSPFIPVAVMLCMVMASHGAEPPQAPAAAAGGAPVEVKEITGKDFPGLELKHPDLAIYNGIRFGDKPEEVIYFAYAVRRVEPSAKSKKESDPMMYELLYAYTPHLPDFQKPKLLRGKISRERLESGYMSGEFVEYPSIKLQTRKGAATLNINLALSYRGGRPQGDAEVQMVHEGKTARLLVKLDKIGRSSAEAPIPAMKLFEEAKLKMRVMDNGKSVVATLCMGELDRPLIPLSGMLGAVMLNIKWDGRLVETKKLSLDQKRLDKGDDFLDIKVGRLAPGKTYTYELTSDLGPLGKPTISQEVSVEAKASRL